MPFMKIFKQCPLCESPIDGANNYCRGCYSSYKRSLYANNPEAKMKQRARIKAQNALNKGLIFKHNCALCNSVDVEMHHPDYSKPLDVIWLCELCHSEIHILERKALCA